jgi:hypothetical protein
LRNIRINGIVGTLFPGLNGIQVLSAAALHIENCTIFGFSQTGINLNLNSASATRVFVTDTVVSNSASGIVAKNAGAGTVFLSVNRTSLTQNTSFGMKADGGGAGPIQSTVSDSLISGNGTGLSAVGGAGAAVILLTRSTVANSVTNGLRSEGAAGQAFIITSNTMIGGNGTALSSIGGGNLLTYKNNAVDGNFAVGAFTGEILPE